jgi:hypothetical protein
LMEHPEVVQTCIPQAVNAYVTDYLREREPKVLDPDYVARTNPTWVEEMVQAHSETHGKEYWRDLLRMTMKEIISEPNYSPADLRRVERPTLVIMGSEDISPKTSLGRNYGSPKALGIVSIAKSLTCGWKRCLIFSNDAGVDKRMK